jgi:hypothetical protein
LHLGGLHLGDLAAVHLGALHAGALHAAAPEKTCHESGGARKNDEIEQGQKFLSDPDFLRYQTCRFSEQKLSFRVIFSHNSHVITTNFWFA